MPAVGIVFGMTRAARGGHLGGRRTVVAVLAGHVDMRAIQDEAGLAVVVADVVPAVGTMTGGATRAEDIAVGILIHMAGGAVHGRPRQEAVLVAAGAGHVNVPAGQLEAREVVVELGGCPRVGCVAAGTVRPKTTAVRLVLEMTAHAVRRRRLQGRQCPRVLVAIHTQGGQMAAGQREKGQCVVEVPAK